MLAPFEPSIIYSSTEPKAVETACIAADLLTVPSKSAVGLEEHARDSVPWLNEESFQEKVRELFKQPDALILGEETAAESLHRFEKTVDDLVVAHPGESIALVSHGTVITLFVCSLNVIDPFEFWKTLTMPCLVLVRVPTMAFERIIDLDSA